MSVVVNIRSGSVGVRKNTNNLLTFFEMLKMDNETLIGSTKSFRVCNSNMLSLIILENEPFIPRKIFCPETDKFVYNVSSVSYREVMFIQDKDFKKIFLPERMLKTSFEWLT